MWIPSFLSFPFTLPSLPSISLPANIQRRFLSYVLRRTLGRFVAPGGLDVERISAQVSEGWIELDGLELDTSAVNEFLPAGLPLCFEKGVIGKVTANLPFPNLWSAPLSFTLDTLTLDFSLSRSERGTTSNQRQSSLELAESVTSAADEFLHQELDAYEEAQLESSIRQSLILSETDPFRPDDVPGSFPAPMSPDLGSSGSAESEMESTTVLASLVERILARLQFKVRNVKLRVHFADENFGGTLELRIGEINGTRTTVRIVRVSHVELHLLPPIAEDKIPVASPVRSQPIGQHRTSISSDSSASNSSETSEEGHGRMDMMASAVADLRQSTVTSASGRSIYYSTMGDSTLSAVQEDYSADPAGSSLHLEDVKQAGEAAFLLSFGNDDMEFRVTTSRSPNSMPAGYSQASRSVNQTQNTLSLSLNVGTVSLALAPSHLATVLAMSTVVSAPQSSHKSNTGPITPLQPSSLRLRSSIDVKAVRIALVYDTSARVAASFADFATKFHARPTVASAPLSHVKVKMEGLSLIYGVATPATAAAENTSEPRAESRRRSMGPGIVVTPLSAVSLAGAVQSLSIYENLQSPSDGTQSYLPILIFDPSLPLQYDKRSGTSSNANIHFPSFDILDWRDPGLQRKRTDEDQCWYSNSRRPSVLKNHKALTGSPVIRSQYDLSGQPRGSVYILPVHLFLDLSLIERLIPALRLVSPAVQSAHVAESPRLAALQYARRPSVPQKKMNSTHSVIDDLDAQASIATLQPETQVKRGSVVRCDMIRVDLRCPAPAKSSGGFGDGVKLRSGIITLDIHDIGVEAEAEASEGSTIRPTVFPRTNDRRVDPSAPSTTVKWTRALLSLSRVNEKLSSTFLIAAPFATSHDEATADIILPSISVTKSSSSASSGKTSSVTVAIPCVYASITQSVLDGLQFFADDVTLWLNGTFGDAKAPKPKDDLKMIGSRFFGSKGSSSASDEELEEEYEAATAATVFRLNITEADIALLMPWTAESGKSQEDQDRSGQVRNLALHAADVAVTFKSNIAGKQETAVTLVLPEMDLVDRSAFNTRPLPILGRTTPFSLALRNQPLLHLRFSTSAHPMTAHITTDVRLALSTATLYIANDLAWVQDLTSFARTPEGVFEDVTPSEVTNISVSLNDCSTHITTPTSGGALVGVLGSTYIESNLVTGAKEKLVTIGIGGARLMAIDDVSVAAPLPVGYASSADAWRKAGYASLVDVVSAGITILKVLRDDPELHLEVEHAQVGVTLCADSLASLGVLVEDLGQLVPKSSSSATSQPGLRRVYGLDQSINVFESIDDNLFEKPPSIGIGLDLMDDDIPRNPDYLDKTSRHKADVPSVDTATGEGLRNWQAGEGEANARLLGEINGETIKVLLAEPFDVEANYWESLPVLSGGDDYAVGNTRVRVFNTSVSIFLYSGYDWIRTRKAIDDEIKAIRRRLERIRQLLASGQQADESFEAERTSSVLFNSVYLGVDRRDGMAPADLLAAIDAELNDMGDADETATQSSWQTQFPARQASAQTTGRTTRHKGKKLSRSKRPQIEFVLASVMADLDVYPADEPTASRLHVTVGALDILDHIKTSTWKKFLTEMKSDSRGNMRETDAEMVRLEVLTVRPGLPASAEEELRIKAKILPLRLHVDQDALDFMKRFFAFKPSDIKAGSDGLPSVSPSAARTKGTQPFFQHVEIFPIELKLDYKPKRLDFAALKEGRTIELMNFFHFDGAEMTLRHVTLSGITGVERLSTSLQDIWTPDVKANQLADVISGVSPIRSVVNVGSGVADLILLPIEQYRKDGRVSRGVQRGTHSFVRSTAMEMMKLGARLATGTQVILEKAEGVLGGRFNDKVVGEVEGTRGGGEGTEQGEEGRAGWSLASSSSSEELEQRRREAVSRYANQPQGVREGVAQGYMSLKGNMTSAAQTILAVPMEVYERSSEDGPLRAVVRAVPIAVLKPMIGASEAVSKTLLGMRNSLDPQARLEQGDKYK